jgi:hypothetical protein
MITTINNFNLIKFIIEKPTTAKLVVAILGLIFGLFVPYVEPKLTISINLLLKAIPFWTLGFIVFFTIYRFIESKSTHKSILSEQFKNYDLRNLFKFAFYYFVPLGISTLLVFRIKGINQYGFALFTIACGISVYVAIIISQIIKK